MIRVQHLLFASLLIAIPFYGFSFFNFRGQPVGRPDIVLSSLLAVAFVLDVVVAQRKVTFNRTMIWILLLNVATLLSTVNAFVNPGFSFAEFSTVAGQVALGSVIVLAVSNFKVDKAEFTRYLQIWLLVSAAIGAYAIYQAFARNLGWPYAYLNLSNPTYVAETGAGQFGGFIRPSSVFFEPSRLGTYLVGPSFLAIITLGGRLGPDVLFRSRVVHWLVALAIISGVVVSFALSGYVALLFGVMVLFFSTRRALRVTQLARIGMRVFVGIMFVIVIFQVFHVNFLSAFGRLSAIVAAPGKDGSLSQRAAYVVVGLRIFADNPIFGVGANQIQFASKAYTFPSWYAPVYASRETGVAATGIMWIDVPAQSGLFGFIALALVFASSLALLRQSMNWCTDPNGKVLSYAFYIALWSTIASISLTHAELMLWVQFAFVHLLVNNVRRFGLFRDEPVTTYSTTA